VSIRSWLYGVALRVALRARQQENLRRRREQETPSRPPSDPATEATWQDVRPILDEEIQRLPEKYRLPIILCYLEGQTNDEAAKMLNCPRGTIATRLARARERLRSRLLRRGVSLSGAALAALLSDNAMSAAIPPLLVGQTAKVVLSSAASASITTLTEGVLHAMFVNKFKMVSAFMLMVAVLGGAGVGAYYLRAQAPPDQVPPPKPAEPQVPQENRLDQKLRKELEELSKKLDNVAPDNKAVGKPEERFQKLLEVRREMAELERDIRYESYRAGANEPGNSNPVTLHLAIDATKHLLKAELELSKKKAERVQARERYLDVIKEIVKISKAQFMVGRIMRGALDSALYEQLDAEIELEREKER
jgi:hypothetical protein